MTTRSNVLGTWLAGLVLLTAVGCQEVELGGGSAGGGDFSTPEATAKSMTTALAALDFAGAYDCLTPESQNLIVGAVVMMGAGMQEMQSKLAQAPPQLKEQLEGQMGPFIAIMERHGVTADAVANMKNKLQPGAFRDPAVMSELADKVADKRGFIGELASALVDLAKQNGQMPDINQAVSGELSDVKIEGDTATGKFTTASGEEKLLFQKTAAGWKLHIDTSRLPAGPGMMPPMFGAPPQGAAPPTAEPPSN
jgi:hypothetical protein